MRITILAADSMGVRSMAHIIELEGTVIAVDPGAALGPKRYGLPPHRIEEALLQKTIDRIVDFCREADLIIITHYHYDHYLRGEAGLEAYRGKRIIAKHPSEEINWSQKRRAFHLKKIFEKAGAKVLYTNGGGFLINNFFIELSNPVWHGSKGTALGKLLMLYLKTIEGESYVYASDTQGPMNKEALEWILSKRPEALFISGPPFYLVGTKIDEQAVQKAEANLIYLIKGGWLKRVIIDHHFSREKGYWNRLEKYKSMGKTMVQDAAEYSGVERRPLEAMRDELWRGR